MSRARRYGAIALVLGVALPSAVTPDRAVAQVACSVPERIAPQPDRPRYVVSIDFDPKTAIAQGHTDVEFTPDLPTDRIVIRLWPNGGTRDASAPKATLTNATVGGQSVKISRPDTTTAVLALPAKLNASDTAKIGFDWSVQANGNRKDRVSVTRSKGIVTAARFGSFLPVVAWEPRVGWNLTPPTNGGAEASMHPVADWTVTVAAPGLDILASGQETIDLNNTRTYVSVAQRDWAMSLGTFRTVESNVTLAGGTTVQVKVGVSTLLPARESANAYAKRVTTALQDFSRRYGDYPWPTFTLAITPGLKGGIEYPSHVMQGPGSIGRTTPHEVAHQWFYGLVGNDQGRDPWIDEGLATWAEGRVEGTTSALASKVIPSDGKNRTGSPMTYWDQHRASYYRSVYTQTVSALASLGSPQKVDCALANLVAKYAYDVTVPADVLNELEAQLPGAKEKMAAFGLR